MCNIYNIISISYSCHVCSARNMGTIKGEKLNEPESDTSRSVKKKKKNVPSPARMDSACRVPTGLQTSIVDMSQTRTGDSWMQFPGIHPYNSKVIIFIIIGPPLLFNRVPTHFPFQNIHTFPDSDFQTSQ